MVRKTVRSLSETFLFFLHRTDYSQHVCSILVLFDALIRFVSQRLDSLRSKRCLLSLHHDAKWNESCIFLTSLPPSSHYHWILQDFYFRFLSPASREDTDHFTFCNISSDFFSPFTLPQLMIWRRNEIFQTLNFPSQSEQTDRQLSGVCHILSEEKKTFLCKILFLRISPVLLSGR